MVVSEGKVFYAYIHYKPDFTPFYVGKGLLYRANSLKCRNQYYMATVEKYGAENIIIKSFACSSEANAFELEMFVIQSLKEKGVKLTNFTAGGEGCSNPSPETRAKISPAKIGNTWNKGNNWNKGKTLSAETRAKMSAAKQGEKNNMFGKNHSLEIRAKLSAAKMGNTIWLGKTHSLETRAKLSAAGMGKTLSPETRAKMSAARMGTTRSAETRAKISASHKLRRLNAKL